MKASSDMTPAEIREAAHAAIARELGVTGLIRYLQDSSLGSGDYTRDREQWLPQDETVDELFARVKADVAALRKKPSNG